MMSSGPDSDSIMLQIRCPKCSQRFKVGEELREKTVECGQCEHRFRIEDDVIVRTRRHYPGEKKGRAHLERFSRVTGGPSGVGAPATPPVSSGVPTGVAQPAHYETRKAEDFFPASPQRTLVGAIGAFALLVTLVILILTSTAPPTPNDMSKESKWVIAALVSMIGTGMLFYANRRARGKAMLFALGTSVAMFVVPALQPAAVPYKPDDSNKGPEVVVAPVEELKKEIGYGPVEREIEALGDPTRVVAIWMRDMAESHKLEIRDFLLRETGAKDSSHMYPRNKADCLFVLSDVKVSYEGVEQLVAQFGEVRRRLPDLRLLEVAIDDSKFAEGPVNRLNDQKDPHFYELNVRELDAISLQRAERAVERLTRAEPVRFRADVTKRLMRLLEIGDDEMQEKCTLALLTWSDRPEQSDAAVLQRARAIFETKNKLPEAYVRYLSARKVPDSLPMMVAIWKKEPEVNEEMLSGYGVALEESMLAALRDKEQNFRERQSAARLLGMVGSAKVLPALEEVRKEADAELKLVLDRAMADIKKR